MGSRIQAGVLHCSAFVVRCPADGYFVLSMQKVPSGFPFQEAINYSAIPQKWVAQREATMSGPVFMKQGNMLRNQEKKCVVHKCLLIRSYFPKTLGWKGVLRFRRGFLWFISSSGILPPWAQLSVELRQIWWVILTPNLGNIWNCLTGYNKPARDEVVNQIWEPYSRQQELL